MQENEKEEKTLEDIAKAFVDLLKMAGRKHGITVEAKTEEKEAFKKDALIEELLTVSRKARDENRSFVLMMESEDETGCISIINGRHCIIVNMLTETASQHKAFEEAIKRASVKMSLSAIDELMKNNNPFKKSEPAQSYNSHKL